VYGRYVDIARNSQWLSTVIYTVIYVDNSRLDALQKKSEPPLAGPDRAWSQQLSLKYP